MFADEFNYQKFFKVALGIVGVGLVAGVIVFSLLVDPSQPRSTFVPPTQTVIARPGIQPVFTLPTATATATRAASSPRGTPTPTLTPLPPPVIENPPTTTPTETSVPPTPTRPRPTATPVPPTDTPVPKPTLIAVRYPAIKLREPQTNYQVIGSVATFEWEVIPLQTGDRFRVAFKRVGQSNWEGGCAAPEKTNTCIANFQTQLGEGNYEWTVFIADKDGNVVSQTGEVRKMDWRLVAPEPVEKPCVPKSPKPEDRC